MFQNVFTEEALRKSSALRKSFITTMIVNRGELLTIDLSATEHPVTVNLSSGQKMVAF